MYYIAVLLLFLFKIPPRKKFFRRLSTSLAKRGRMVLYEYAIESYDRGAMLYTRKNCESISFVGSGHNPGVLNSYRKIELKDQTLFEKIYFKERKEKVIIFKKWIQPVLLARGLKMAKLVQMNEGERLFVAYYQYLDLTPLHTDQFLEKAIDIAAEIANVKFNNSAKLPEFINTYKLGDYHKTIENFQKEISSQIPGTDTFLYRVNEYIDQHIPRTLNHRDLSEKNTFKDGKVIDWDNFGFAPVGYDFGLIIGLANQENITLEKYLELEDKIYNKISGLLSKKEFQISLPFFTAVLLRSLRVKSRFENEKASELLAFQLVKLLRERFNPTLSLEQ
jgi:hypothetical protein